MSLKRKLISIITLVFAVAAFSIFVPAQDQPAAPPPPQKEGKMGRGFGEGRGGPRGKHGMLMRSLHGIDLTDAQRTQIKSMMEIHRANFAPNHDEVRSLMDKKRDGTVTEAETARLTEIHSQMKASAKELKNSILALLTPEQNAKLEKMKAERRQRMMERRERRGNNPQPPEPPKPDDQ